MGVVDGEDEVGGADGGVQELPLVPVELPVVPHLGGGRGGEGGGRVGWLGHGGGAGRSGGAGWQAREDVCVCDREGGGAGKGLCSSAACGIA